MRHLLRILLLALLAGPAFAASDAALEDFARRHGLNDVAGFVETVRSIENNGRLPDRYVTKGRAEQLGWEPGRDLCEFAMGKSILDRSSTLNVGELCLAYGGGGHFNAGTCQIDNDQAEEKLAEIIAGVALAGHRTRLGRRGRPGRAPQPGDAHPPLSIELPGAQGLAPLRRAHAAAARRRVGLHPARAARRDHRDGRARGHRPRAIATTVLGPLIALTTPEYPGDWPPAARAPGSGCGSAS